jgi:hypothetical protein
MATTTQRLIHAAQIKAGRGWAKKKPKKTDAEYLAPYSQTDVQLENLLTRIEAHPDAQTLLGMRMNLAALTLKSQRELELKQYRDPKLRAVEHRNEDGKPFMIDCPEWVRDLIKNREG